MSPKEWPPTDFRATKPPMSVFFSFGLIKHQTSLGGALVRFRDPALADRCRQVQQAWPLQSTQAYRLRIFRSLVLSVLSTRCMASAVALALSLIRFDPDEWLGRSTRGFPESDLFRQLRMRPC